MFSFDPATKTLTPFTSNVPLYADAVRLTLGPSGLLYGVTSDPGSGPSLFSFDPTTGQYALLHRLAPGSYSPLTVDGNLLVGTSTAGANGTGEAFAYDPTANILTDLYDFTPQDANGANADGVFQQGAVNALTLGPDGNLYGAVPMGGPNGNGVLFQFAPKSAAVPEPAPSALLALGLLPLCLLAVRRRPSGAAAPPDRLYDKGQAKLRFHSGSIRVEYAPQLCRQRIRPGLVHAWTRPSPFSTERDRPMHFSRRPGLSAGTTLALLVAAAALAAPAGAQVGSTALFRNIFNQQTGVNTTTVDGADFDARLFTQNATDVATVSLDYPGPGSPASLTPDGITPGEGFTYRYNSGELPTQADVDAAYPSGTYTVNYGGGTLAAGSVVTTDTGDVFSTNTPTFDAATVNGLPSFDVSQPFALSFAPFQGALPNPMNGPTNSFDFVTIFDRATNAFVVNDGFLSPGTTSILLPANTLSPDTSYTAELIFSNRLNGFDAVDQTFTEQGFDQRTDFNFTSASAAVPEPSPLALLLGPAAGPARRQAPPPSLTDSVPAPRRPVLTPGNFSSAGRGGIIWAMYLEIAEKLRACAAPSGPAFTREGLAKFFGVGPASFSQDGAALTYHQSGSHAAISYVLKGTVFFADTRQVVRGYPRILPASDYTADRFAATQERRLLSGAARRRGHRREEGRRRQHPAVQARGRLPFRHAGRL